MQKKKPFWKVILAIFSLLLTILVWQRGLVQSFDRPSVNPKLTLNQREMAVLAEPSLPNSIKPFFVGEDPKNELKNALNQIGFDELSDRERLLLAALDDSEDIRRSLLRGDPTDDDLSIVKEKILSSVDKSNSQSSIGILKALEIDPLLFRLSCFSVGGDGDMCLNAVVSRQMAVRLLFSQLFPLLATLIGTCLVVWYLLIYFRGNTVPWSDVSALPISIVDVTLLVAGGFVVLGELLTPLLAIPFADLLTREVPSPLNESLKVFIGYVAMTVPPLLILRQQINSIKNQVASGEWFHWGIDLVPKSFVEAVKGWFMVMPFVLLVSWITTFFFGDPGGSNPLLEMVLSSKNIWALAVLLLTTVFIAPLFEELIFRGVLLPVLVREQGRVLGLLISGLIFALAHLSVGETPPLFVLGVGLGLLRLSSGRLLPCVMMHSLWNGITFANLLILSA